MKREINADVTTKHEFIFVRARNFISQLRRHRARNTIKFVEGANTKRLKDKTKQKIAFAVNQCYQQNYNEN